jgi:hypothetical protein
MKEKFLRIQEPDPLEVLRKKYDKVRVMIQSRKNSRRH